MPKGSDLNIQQKRTLCWLNLAIMIACLATIIHSEGRAKVKERIALRPIGEIDQKVMVRLRERLEESFKAEVEVVEPMEVPENAYTPGRGQYHSTPILDKVRGFSGAGDFDKALGIIDVDLYVPGLNFVFGEASPAEGVAIISLVRLRQEYYGLPKDEELFLERVVKEAVHELGHLYGLRHCRNPKCVMYFSNSLVDTDRKGSTFCPEHQRQLELTMG